MRKVIFGRTGLEVSPLGFGGAPIGFLKTDRERVARMLNYMLDRGVNVIDTAAMYEGSEELIGQAIGHRRAEYVLVSKCGTRIPELDAPAWSAETIIYTVDRALERLRTDVVDVMLLHSCDLETLRQGEAVQALLQAKKAGKIGYAGYSGDDEAAAYAAGLPEIDVIQASVNIVDHANVEAVLPVARKNEVGVMAKRPIANAAWKRLKDQPEFYKSYAANYTERFQKMNVRPEDLGFRGAPGEVWPEIALRFTLSQPGVHTAIIGTTNPENAQRNIEAAEKGPLPDEVVERIREAFRRAEAASGSRWVGQT